MHPPGRASGVRRRRRQRPVGRAARRTGGGIHTWGARPLPVGCTRRGATTWAALDIVVVPSGEAWRWGATPEDPGHLSDHAIVRATRDNGAR
eukprot:15440541-Alexandrium_andersonii.AAC.1